MPQRHGGLANEKKRKRLARSVPTFKDVEGLKCLSGRYFCLAALNLCQRARCAAAILFRAAAEIVRFFAILFGFGWALLLTFAQRAR